MEKINIAELLKDCPRGMELDYALFEDTIFIGVEEDKNYPILIKLKNGSQKRLTKYGGHSNADNAKCVIFPKGKTTWEGFKRPFEDGDILVSSLGNIFIFKELNEYNNAIVYCALDCYIGNGIVFDNDNWTAIAGCRHATEEEKQKLFDAIKAKGYKWNPETKTLEKLLSFKVGDRIKRKGDYISGIITQIDIENFYKVEYCSGGISYINSEYQDNYELVPVEPYFKIGDKIKHKTYISQEAIVTEIKDTHYILDGESALPFKFQDEYELVRNKFDINNLVPFKSRVLIRGADGDLWKPAIYGFSHPKGCYVVGGVYWRQCIPYEGNEHLLGATNNCDEFFKTW